LVPPQPTTRNQAWEIDVARDCFPSTRHFRSSAFRRLCLPPFVVPRFRRRCLPVHRSCEPRNSRLKADYDRWRGPLAPHWGRPACPDRLFALSARAPTRNGRSAFQPPKSRSAPATAPPKTTPAGRHRRAPDAGPIARKTPTRTPPPPPTNFTVMYKLEYVETLEYVPPTARCKKF